MLTTSMYFNMNIWADMLVAWILGHYMLSLNSSRAKAAVILPMHDDAAAAAECRWGWVSNYQHCIHVLFILILAKNKTQPLHHRPSVCVNPIHHWSPLLPKENRRDCIMWFIISKNTLQVVLNTEMLEEWGVLTVWFPNRHLEDIIWNGEIEEYTVECHYNTV